MTNLNINVDMGRVQSSVQAAIRPAVEQALAGVDVKKFILDALLKPVELDPYQAMFFGRRGAKAPSMLDSMIQEGVNEIAKQYVQRVLHEQQPEIELAFQKMMAGSTNRLVKAFAAATEQALKSDWGFELDVKVSHTEKKDRDDD